MTQKLSAEPTDALDPRSDDEIADSAAPLTDSPDSPATPIEPPTERRRLRLPTFGLSATTLVATGLAAITATFAASFLGVAGTVVGAALFSVITAVGKEVFGQSLRRTGSVVREAVPATLIAPRPAGDTRSLPVAEPELPSATPVRRAGTMSPAWKRAAIAAVAVFVAVLAVVTGVELIAGRPLADVVRGDSGHGTTFFGGETRVVTTTVPPVAPTVYVTVTPKVVITTPTVTSAAPTRTVTNTPSATVSGTPTSSSGNATGGQTGESADRNGTPNHPTASASSSARP